MTWLTLIYPPFLTSTLASKRTMLIKIWKVLLKKSIHRLLKDFHTTQSLSLLWKSSWHLRPPSQRSILHSWIVYQSLHLNSSIASHIRPKRTYWLKLSLHVLSVSGFTVLPVESLLSVKRASLSSQLPRNHLRSKLLSNTGWFSTTLLCRLHLSVLQRCLDNKLCLFCGTSRHVTKDCPNSPSASSKARVSKTDQEKSTSTNPDWKKD